MSFNPPPTAPIKAPIGKSQEFKVKSQESMVSTYSWECCINCDNWDDKLDICKKFEQRPPTKVIVVGCVEYVPDIPF